MQLECPKKEILMDYVSKSCDSSGMVFGRLSKGSCDCPKKEILMAYVSSFGTHIAFGIVQKRKFDGLCKQVM